MYLAHRIFLSSEGRSLFMTSTLTRRFIPPTDILELPDRLRVVVEIAGIQQDDVNITVINRALVISGTRRRYTVQPVAYHQLEIGYGEFRLHVALPWSIEPDRVTAIYQDGFLLIDLPRSFPTSIHVSDGSAQHNHSETIDHDATEIE
jgi:HSP20 family protein